MSVDTPLMEIVAIRDLNRLDYADTLMRQKNFTRTRTGSSVDELWMLEHEPVFSLGQNSKPQHILAPGDIPVVQSDRGGQVTYHGPGQLVVYLLFDLKRKGLGVRQVVDGIESAVIDLLGYYGLPAEAKKSAPGVYVAEAKVCSLGLRVSRGCAYHGLSLNVKMDLEPYSRINPCGFPGLAMEDLHGLGVEVSMADVKQELAQRLLQRFSYRHQTPEGWCHGF
jgi:lipoyl(octanoyl) transferase